MKILWNPAITKCHGTERKCLLYNEDPVITNYLVISKNIRYSNTNYQKFNTVHRNHYFYSFDTARKTSKHAEA